MFCKCAHWELNPQTFNAANAMLYHRATGTISFMMMHQSSMAHIVWYNKEKTAVTQTEHKYEFDADADIYTTWWNSDACNVNQWDLYNSGADSDITWSKYSSISAIICLSKMRCKWSKHIMQCWLRDEETNAPQKMWDESKAHQMIIRWK